MRLALAATFALLTWTFASAARADGPRVAVLVEGDPAETTTAAAARIEAALLGTNEIALPSDPLVRDALRGAPGTPEDGLDALRGLRRRIGWSTEGDQEVLVAIGAQLELVALIVVHGGESPAARVYDTHASHYFVGEGALDEASLESTTRFVLARVRAAERRRVAPPPGEAASTTEQPSEPTTQALPAPTSAATGAATTTDDAAVPPRRRWIRRNWPFFVAGALLVGATTFFIVQRDDRDTTPPVIHVRPGGSP